MALLPPSSTTAQNVADGHATEVGVERSGITFPLCCVHEAPFHMRVPPCSTATHKLAEEHDTASVGSTVAAALDHVDPCIVNALNALSTAAQNVVVGHDTDVSEPVSTGTPVDQVEPFHVKAFPFAGVPVSPSPTATQNVLVGQDTDFSGPPAST